MSESLFASESLSRVHLKKSDHKLESFLGETGHVSFLKSLWFRYFGELEANEAWILIEKLLLVWGQLAEDFLNAEKLINF